MEEFASSVSCRQVGTARSLTFCLQTIMPNGGKVKVIQLRQGDQYKRTWNSRVGQVTASRLHQEFHIEKP